MTRPMEMLTKVRDLLKAGWTAGSLKYAPNDTTPQYCLIGAVSETCDVRRPLGGLSYPYKNQPGDIESAQKLLRHLALTLAARRADPIVIATLHEEDLFDYLYTFNDTSNQDLVVGLVEDTIARVALPS